MENSHEAVDEKTAPFVKLIFEWKADGVSNDGICKRLEEMGAVTPAKRKVELGLWKAEKYHNSFWYMATILGILKNATYTGMLIYGKRTASLYEGIKEHRTEKEEWICIPDAHEAIITMELFEKVQRIIAENAEKKREAWEKNAAVRDTIVDHFKGKVFCGDCGRRMRFVKPNSRVTRFVDQDHAVYACSGHVASRGRVCSRHMIHYPEVEDAVISLVEGYVSAALDYRKLIRQIKGSPKEKSLIDNSVSRINYLSQELKRIENKRQSLYEGLSEGLIDEEEYWFAMEKYSRDADCVKAKLNEAGKREEQLEQVLNFDNKWLSLHEVKGKLKSDPILLNDLIKEVRIYEGRRVEVDLNYQEDREILEEIIKEIKGEESCA